MHILQPKHCKLKKEEVSKLLEKYNISLTQLPKIKFGDHSLPENCEIGEVVRIERKVKGEIKEYFRVVIA